MAQSYILQQQYNKQKNATWIVSSCHSLVGRSTEEVAHFIFKRLLLVVDLGAVLLPPFEYLPIGCLM
jgi:hypothetical protein